MPNKRRSPAATDHRYPRTARVNEVLRQVVADELERLADVDERLRLLTVTGIETDRDLRHATVWLASISADAAEGLADVRVRLQAAIGRQVRMKWTPLLTFVADPAVATGMRVEQLLRGIDAEPPADAPPDS
jgi:ribosome-binding factor A